jgi:hypothetical protein
MQFYWSNIDLVKSVAMRRNIVVVVLFDGQPQPLMVSKRELKV